MEVPVKAVWTLMMVAILKLLVVIRALLEVDRIWFEQAMESTHQVAL
jgi:hypothetical protein